MATRTTRVEVTGETSKYERAMRDVRRVNAQTTNVISSAWKKVGGVFAGVFAASAIKGAVSDWVRLAGVQQEAVAGFHQALVSMGRYTPEFEQQMFGVASSIQNVTTQGDEATLEGLKFMATYQNIGNEVMPRAAMVMADLASMMGGNVRSAANMLGKASMGLSGELRKVGITIDETVAKSGDFSAILTEIEKQVGGQAKALAATGVGPWKQLGNIVGDAKEALGDLALEIGNNMLPMLNAMASGVEKTADAFANMIKTDPEKIRKQIRTLKEEMISGDPDWIKFMYGEPAQIAKIIKEKEKELAKLQLGSREEYIDSWLKKPQKTTPGKPDLGGQGLTDGDILRRAQIYESHKEMYNIHEQLMLSDKSAYMGQHYEKEAEHIAAVHSMKLDATYNHEAMKLAVIENSMTAEMQLAYKVTKEIIKAEQLKEKAKRESIKRSLDYAAYALNQLGQHNQVAFRMYQGVEIGKAVMSTHAAVVKALAEVPWPFNWIEAGARAAFGAAQVAQIASQSPAGGGGVSVAGGGGAIGTYPASPTTSLPVSAIGQTPDKPTTTIIIEGDFVGDEAFVDHLVEKINAAEDRDVYINKTAYARELE